MKTQEAEALRLSPLRAEWCVAAVDVLVLGLGLVVLRFAFARMAAPPAGGAGLDAFAIAWGLGGIALALALLFWCQQMGHYDRRRPLWQEVGDIVGAGLALATVDTGLGLVGGINPRLPVGAWLLALVLLPTVRFLLRRRLDALGLWRRPTIVIGTGENARRAARALLSEPSLGLPVVAFAALPVAASEAGAAPGTIEVEGRSLPVMPLERLLVDFSPSGAAPHVVLAPEAAEMAACGELFERLAASSAGIDFVPPLGPLPVADAKLARFVGSNVASIRLRDRLSAPFARLYKRTFDLVVGSALCVFTAPLIAALALAILIVDGRPVFFWQRRVGMNGRPFPCLKFRTMVPDAQARLADLLARDPVAHAEWEQDRKLKNDPRISRLGGWLRRTSLDELPQLFNVVRGDMSLIGPRPVVEEELQRYGPHAALYLKTRPGLSGLWQVSGRNDVDYVQRVSLDCQYVRNWTPWWDLALLFATVRVVFSRRGAY